jgi:hypothetical protein
VKNESEGARRGYYCDRTDTEEATMRRGSKGRLGFAGLLLALGLVAAACNNDTNTPAGAGGGPTLQIVSPSDGNSVTSPFELKVDASVPLGQPETGDDHVHLCFDGASCDSGDYVKVYSDTTQVTLPPGEHTIEARLRNADHSDAGVTDTITVTVASGGGTGTGSPSPSGGGNGYGY